VRNGPTNRRDSQPRVPPGGSHLDASIALADDHHHSLARRWAKDKPSSRHPNQAHLDHTAQRIVEASQKAGSAHLVED